MKVSIIINCYNSEKFLRETINSVLKQTYKNYELIIFDDASTDSTKDIALSYGDKVKYYNTKKNIPLGLARNLALEKSTGDLIAFLDHDDIIYPERLKYQVNFFKKNPDVDLVFSSSNIIDENSKIINGIMPNVSIHSKTENFRDILKYYPICWLTVMFRRKVIDEIGNFEDEFNQIEELDLILRIISRKKFKFLPDIVGAYRVHSDNLSKKNNYLSVKKEFKRCYQNLIMEPTISFKYKKYIFQEYLKTPKKFFFIKFSTNECWLKE